jgi:hypothetical protein
MSTGRNQHQVPQMMIKRFASAGGTLTELIKPNLEIGSRGRWPKGILFGEDFYRDHQSDLEVSAACRFPRADQSSSLTAI